MEPSELAASIREQRSARLQEAQSILDATAVEGETPRDLTVEEQARWDGLMTEINELDRRAQRFESLANAKAVSTRQSPASEMRGVLVPAGARVEIATPQVSLRAYGRGTDQRTGLQEAHRVGRWLAALMYGHQQSIDWCRDNFGDQELRALGTTANSAGGVLVPEEMERAIILLREDRGVARRNVTVMPMASDTIVIPRYQSGLTAYFTGEGSDITTSDPAFDSIRLTLRKLATLTQWSAELNEQAIVSMADMLSAEIAYAFADKEDSCLFLGTGTSTYGGTVGLIQGTLAGSKYTALAGNTAFSTLDLDDFEAMVGKLPQYAVAGAKWYISRAGWASSMLRLAAAAGGNTVTNIQGSYGAQFLGFPVEFVQVMNSTLTAQTSTNGLCYLGDLRLAAHMGVGGGVRIDVDNSRYFEKDLLAIRGVERIDINYHETGTATVAGPVIMLSTPGS
ncbi:MAG: phage major capsid protein [Caulobacteraceae bacterium]|nr:phage major capsid protein [Caulobacteraceae bacterium]